MNTARVITVAAILACLGVLIEAAPAPDSAGVVDMVPGLAYGGIPYGTVSGNLRRYNEPQPIQHYPHLTYNTVYQRSAALPVQKLGYNAFPYIGDHPGY